jgi:hypothetical protein
MSIHAKKRRLKVERWRSQIEIIRKAVRNAVQIEDSMPLGELPMRRINVEIIGCPVKLPN